MVLTCNYMYMSRCLIYMTWHKITVLSKNSKNGFMQIEKVLLPRIKAHICVSGPWKMPLQKSPS